MNGTVKASDFQFTITGGTFLASSLHSTMTTLYSAVSALGGAAGYNATDTATSNSGSLVTSGGVATAINAVTTPTYNLGITTLQVTGSTPIFTTSAINIDDNAATYITFAGSFTTNGINHPNNSSLFNINVAAEYTANVQLRCTLGAVNERGMYWVICR